MNYQDLFQCLKGVGNLDLSGLALSIAGTGYVLCPISCRVDNTDEGIINMLTIARNANANSFLTFFKATPERTKGWLINSVAFDSTRILFSIKEIQSGKLYGYMGLAYGNEAGTRIEGDAIVRYSEHTEPGLMRMAFTLLVEWVIKNLGFREVWVRVLTDNPAVKFYTRCSFAAISEVPLYEVMNPSGEIEALTETPAEKSTLSGRSILYMKYLKS